MTGSRPHTRRPNLNTVFPASAASSYLPPLNTQNDAQRHYSKSLSLRKSATFHSPTSPSSSDDDPIVNIQFLPRRSPTCSKALEDVVAAGEKRFARLLGVVDRSLSGLEKFSNDSQDTWRAEDLPVPRFMLDAHIGSFDHMEVDRAPDQTDHSPHLHRKVQKHHASDSGIGSTMTGSEQSLKLKAATANVLVDTDRMQTSSVSALHSSVYGSFVSPKASGNGMPHALGEYACRQIQKYIIVPIIRKNALKDFHPLVAGIPYRVGRKEITCLRDLEKVLLWLAPKWSVSKASFIRFCETSIQCIYTTVGHLNEPDQRRPSDRPYTNGYFLDLTEQVRQYAEMITASRECMAAGRRPPGDYSPDDRLGLHGGLSQNGRPAQLVRIKNGRSISLQTGEEMEPEARFCQRPGSSMTMELDFEIERSMGRRRKAEPAAIKQQKCKECDKTFKRPCDLTKHEKTHSRPWKCSESSCKYHHYGWPTEKERDRHVNDKHSTTPSMYKCRYHPCPYESKRESNCKQHMEKAHGWAYVRSKNNGKTGKKGQSSKPPFTPQLTSPASNIFDASSPDLSFAPGSYSPHDGYSINRSGDGSVAATESSTPNSSIGMPFIPVEESYRPLDPIFGFDDANPSLTSFARPEAFFDTQRPAWDEAPITTFQPGSSSFETSLTLQDQEILFSDNVDWSNLNTDFTSYGMQLITPASSVGTRPCDGFSRYPSLSHERAADNPVPSLSPGAQDVMLYSPYSNYDSSRDEGYDDFVSDAGKPDSDFALFDSSSTRPESYLGCLDKKHMFQDLATMVPSAWSGRGTDLAHQLGTNELVQMDEE